MLLAAVQATRQRKLSAAVWADRVCRESVERLPAVSTLPVVPERGRRLTTWAGKPFPARQLGELQKHLGVFESTPAIHQHEKS